jgi:prepilin-type N-terminal cleavage/methylation domain-containing protein
MKRGFSLIELLASIAVIAVLTAIIVPSMSVVRARADSVNCLGNLRSLGVALSSYLAENQMKMPELEAARADKSEDVPVIDNTLDAYLSSPKVFLCPSDGEEGKVTGTSYYWNSTLNGQPLASLNFLALFSDHTKIPVLVDKEGWHKKTKEKVNHLFADGHATNELRLFSE